MIYTGYPARTATAFTTSYEALLEKLSLLPQEQLHRSVWAVARRTFRLIVRSRAPAIVIGTEGS